MRKPGEDLQNPTYHGPKARIWEVDSSGRDEISVQDVASLGIWLIEAPMASSLWNYYAATLVHLHDIPGASPVTYKRPGATHEYVMGTINPEADNTVDPNDIKTFKMLEPPDLHEQLILPSNERALEVVRFAMQQCVDGSLSPNIEGCRADWVKFLRDQEA